MIKKNLLPFRKLFNFLKDSPLRSQTEGLPSGKAAGFATAQQGRKSINFSFKITKENQSIFSPRGQLSLRAVFSLVCALTLFGCSYGQDYLENPDTFIRDPHFAGYQKKRDNLEKAYLRKDITYAQYMEQRNQIDETYAKEVQERDNKIMSSP